MDCCHEVFEGSGAAMGVTAQNCQAAARGLARLLHPSRGVTFGPDGRSADGSVVLLASRRSLRWTPPVRHEAVVLAFAAAPALQPVR